MTDKNNYAAKNVSCPAHAKEINDDLCQDYQMQGNAEFVPRVIEEELSEDWINQCKICESMHGKKADPLNKPEMILE